MVRCWRSSVGGGWEKFGGCKISGVWMWEFRDGLCEVEVVGSVCGVGKFE